MLLGALGVLRFSSRVCCKTLAMAVRCEMRSAAMRLKRNYSLDQLCGGWLARAQSLRLAACKTLARTGFSCLVRNLASFRRERSTRSILVYILLL